MYIEIRNVQFINKGAELMLNAILQKMRKKYPEAIYVMAPSIYNLESNYFKRGEYGLMQKAWLWRYNLQWGNLARLVPRRIRRMFGVVLDSEIDVVLDASGFAYGDQWGQSSVIEVARSSKKWRTNSTNVILLPQALGPFSSEKIISSVKETVDNVDLIFAREKTSYDNITKIVGCLDKIHMAPDFTNLIEGEIPADYDNKNNQYCIVPNYRMIDMTDQTESDAYVPFLIKCVNYLQSKGYKPFILIHEGKNDMVVANEIAGNAMKPLNIIVESDPILIKGILGASKGTIGSRFHGLVSALSQGVPTIGTGWSHKYAALFEDYGFLDGLIDVTSTDEQIFSKIDLITDPDSSRVIRENLIKKSNHLKTLSEEMWEEVFQVIRGDN